jgi:hypothetical protein
MLNNLSASDIASLLATIGIYATKNLPRLIRLLVLKRDEASDVYDVMDEERAFMSSPFELDNKHYVLRSQIFEFVKQDVAGILSGLGGIASILPGYGTLLGGALTGSGTIIKTAKQERGTRSWKEYGKSIFELDEAGMITHDKKGRKKRKQIETKRLQAQQAAEERREKLALRREELELKAAEKALSSVGSHLEALTSMQQAEVGLEGLFDPFQQAQSTLPMMYGMPGAYPYQQMQAAIYPSAEVNSFLDPYGGAAVYPYMDELAMDMITTVEKAKSAFEATQFDCSCGGTCAGCQARLADEGENCVPFFSPHGLRVSSAT